MKKYILKKRNKYNAQPTYVEDIRFDSKKEAERYKNLLLLQKANIVDKFLLQPRFEVGGGVKYYADFIIFWSNGTVTIEDVKSPITAKKSDFIIKKKIIETKYDLPIEIVI